MLNFLKKTKIQFDNTDEDNTDSEYYENESNDNIYTPLVDNSKIMVYNYRKSMVFYCLFDFINTFITYCFINSNIKYLYIFYSFTPLVGYIGSHFCNYNYLLYYNFSIILNIIFKTLFFFKFTSFKILINFINILMNTWNIKLIYNFITLLKKLNDEEIKEIINNEYVPEYKINFIYY